MHRLLLVTAYEALEMAGVVSHGELGSESRNIGTFYGQSSDDWRQVNSSQVIDTFHIPGGMRAFGPGRINYHFGWEGPSMSVDTACSASTVAIQLACNSLRLGECNTALAGGVNIMTAPDLFAGLSRGNFLSPSGSCKTWDQGADGYCRGDAVGTIVLKRLNDAIRDNDNILGVIKSVVTNHSADAISITHPHSETQKVLYERVLEKAGVTAKEVDYIEMHGTGTIAGDAAESASVASVFGESHTKKQPLLIGAVKSNVGHGEAASGITSVIKALMMFRENLIPKHVGIKTAVNEQLATFALDTIQIPEDTVPFDTTNADGRRRILINNFNATSGNTSLLIEDFPTKVVNAEDPRLHYVIAVSAATPNSFKGNVERLIGFLKSKPDVKPSDLSYTTTARRTHHAVRFACVAADTDGLIEQLKRADPAHVSLQHSNQLPPVIFLFTGQSSQYWGMGRKLYETSKVFRQHLHSSETTSKMLMLPSFLDLIRDDKCRTFDPVRTQLAIVALELALASLWKSWGIRPTVVIGHSLGEFAALCIAGVISIKDTFYLVGRRASLMATKCTIGSHSMMSVKISSEQLQQVISEFGASACEIACFNGPESTVVSGPRADIDLLQESLRTKGKRTKLLETSYGFHSSQMDAILGDFRDVVADIRLSNPEIPVVSTLLGQVVSSPGVIDSEYMIRQTRQPVQFVQAIHQCMELISDEKDAFWVEIGPSPQCVNMVRSIVSVQADKLLHSLDQRRDDWLALGDSLAKAYRGGLGISWSEYHKDFEHVLSLLELPSYHFDMQSYWLQYEGDWCVTKGKAQSCIQANIKPLLHSTSLHFVERETITDRSTKVEFTSDLADSKLRATIFGHKVNGLALCPSSVYADMAMTAAAYVCKISENCEEAPAMDVSNLEVFKPLIASTENIGQRVKVIAVKERGSESIDVSINSSTNDSAESHARCVVRLGKSELWLTEWAPDAYLYESRMQALAVSAAQGKAHRILKSMVYKLFSSLVLYEEPFRGIQEVLMDSDMMEATARVQLAPSRDGEDFYCNPHWIDSLGHLSGFVLNGSDTTPDDTVYISHGWQSMRFSRPLMAGKVYQTYVRMRPIGDRHIMIGDVRVFSSGEMIGIFQGVKFQGIRKDVLNIMLPPPAQDVSRTTSEQNLPNPSQKKTTVMARGTFSNSQLLDVLAEELRVDLDELTDETTLDALGIDSLLAISIAAKLQECTQANFSSSLLTSCETIGQLKARVLAETPNLEDNSSTEQSEPDTSATATNITSSKTTSLSSLNEPIDERNPVIIKRPLLPHPSAVFNCTFSYLQRSEDPGGPTVFLLPDGSGSTSSYASIRTFSSDCSVIAFDSPFRDDPHQYVVSLEDLTQKFVSDILSLRQKGPHILGGWSIGGVYAYEAVSQLEAKGVPVKGLILIDTVCPMTMPPLPVGTLDILDAVGIFDSIKKRSAEAVNARDVRGHFLRSIEALEKYTPNPFPAPRISDLVSRCIWVRSGVLELLPDEKKGNLSAEHAEQITNFNDMQKWLMTSRTDQSSGEWEALIGNEVKSIVVDGDHFSMMRNPMVCCLRGVRRPGQSTLMSKIRLLS